MLVCMNAALDNVKQAREYYEEWPLSDVYEWYGVLLAKRHEFTKAEKEEF